MPANRFGSFGADIADATSFHDMLSRMRADFTVEPVGLRTVEGVDVKDRHALVRSDTRKPLAVVSPKYTPIQTKDMLRPLASIVAATKDDPRGLRLLRGGTWGGGEHVWLTARMGDGANTIGTKRDRVEARVTIVVDHSGAGSSIGVLGGLRCECSNQLASLRRRAAWRLPHRGDVAERIAAFQEGLRAVTAEWRRTLAIYSQLADARVSLARRSLEETIRGYTAAVFGRAEIERQTAEGGASRRSNALVAAYNDPTSPDAPGETTGWGLYQALTHYLTHARTMTETRHAAIVDGAAARTSERGIDVAYALSVKQIPLESVLDPDSPAMVAVRRELVEIGV